MKQKVRIHPDVWVGLGSLIIAAVAWTESARYPDDVKLFPRIFTVVFAALTVLIVIKGIILSIKKTKDPESVKESDFWIKLGTVKYPLITLGLLIGYMVLIKYIGMYIASGIYAIVAMRFFGEKRWKMNIIISVVMIALLFLMMDVALKVTLPKGIIIKWIFG